MKLKCAFALSLAIVLAAPAAMAQVITYYVTYDSLTCTTTKPCGLGDDEFQAAGTWEGADSTITINWNGGPPANNPTIVAATRHADFVRTFDTSVQSGCDGGVGSPAPSSYSAIKTQIKVDFGAGNIGAVTANGPDWDVDFGPLSIGTYSGHGIYCSDVPDICPGGCAAGGLSVDSWGPGPPQISPQDVGTLTFAGDLLSFAGTGSWRQFDFNPALNIYGVYSNMSGTGPYNKVLAVPFMAPAVALAMAGGLVYMGVQSLRREDTE